MTKKNRAIIIAISMVIIWGGVFYGSFRLVKDYYDQSIAEINAKNQAYFESLETHVDSRIEEIGQTIESMNLEIDGLSGDLEALNGEIDGLSEALEAVNLTLADTDVVQIEIGDRLGELDKQLKALKESLDILVEAPSEVE